MGVVTGRIIRCSNAAHQKLAWPAAFAVLCWAISGFLHPVMTWTGPQAIKHRAPALVTDTVQLQGIDRALQQLNTASVIKVVPSSVGNLLQVTEQQHEPRAYWQLNNGTELADYDQQQARWLASYYTGITAEKIADVTMVKQFDDEYPWVNRLLPVYRVAFNDEQQHVAFVYTETNALAGLTNSYKTQVQMVFRSLHTWSWLDPLGSGRVVIIAFLMLSLLIMTLSGMVYLFSRPWRKMPARQRWHRGLGYGIWLFTLCWSFSGFYHLLHSEYSDSSVGVKLTQQVDIKQVSSAAIQRVINGLPAQPIGAINLLAYEQSTLLRVSQLDPVVVEVHREQRFNGIPSEQKASYFDGHSGEVLDGMSDQKYALWLAQKYQPQDQIGAIEKVTRFGQGYDFRNKRLPVWRVAFQDEKQTHLYIDAQSGVLADHSDNNARLESLSFSLLHKWNMLTPLMGRAGRDSAIVICLLILFGFAATGILMLTKRRRKTRRTLVLPTGQAGLAE